MIILGRILWFISVLWLSISDLLYMKLPYPALLLCFLSGVLRVLPEYLNVSGNTHHRVIMTLLTLVIIGGVSAYTCRNKYMGKGDLIILMIMGMVFSIDQLLVILSLGFLLAGMTALLIVWTSETERLPLIPFLGIGCLFVEWLG